MDEHEFVKNNIKLEAKNIVKNFEETIVLDDVSIILKEREFVSIIGPSGCGKSTIFNIISGLTRPDGGEVFIDKKNYTGITGRVSYMHQKDLLLPWKKIIDNVCIPLIIKGENRKNAREKAGAYFELFGLGGFEHKYPYQLSGGMKQRAALLRTYLFASDIMLLDEPFGGLDALTKGKMYVWLKTVTSELRSSVLFITHDIEEAIFLSDRILILTDRPSRIQSEIKIKLKLPAHRDEEIITSKEFVEIKKDIIHIINHS